MTLVRAIIVSPEEAADGNAEFWCGPEQLAVTVFHEGRIAPARRSAPGRRAVADRRRQPAPRARGRQAADRDLLMLATVSTPRCLLGVADPRRGSSRRCSTWRR